MDNILEILKRDLNNEISGIDFTFIEETSSFTAKYEKNITNNNVFIINGQTIKQNDRKVIINVVITVVGDFDECWISSSDEKTPISIIGYKITSNEDDIESELVNFCEVAYCAEDIYNNIKEMLLD